MNCSPSFNHHSPLFLLPTVCSMCSIGGKYLAGSRSCFPICVTLNILQTSWFNDFVFDLYYFLNGFFNVMLVVTVIIVKYYQNNDFLFVLTEWIKPQARNLFENNVRLINSHIRSGYYNGILSCTPIWLIQVELGLVNEKMTLLFKNLNYSVHFVMWN